MLLRSTLTAAALTGLLMLGSCGHGHDVEGHEHDEADHGHAAPHGEVGGMLVELGDHWAQMEVVPDFAAGSLYLFFLDGHAESPARLAQEAIQVNVTIGAETFALTLSAQASALTGETVGDSSEFFVQDERLVGVGGFEAEILAVEVMGTSFQGLKVDYRGGQQ